MTDLTNLTVAQIRDGHRAGDFSAVEVAEAFNANVAGAKALNAFIVETPEHAIAAAKQADADRAAGTLKPLSGVPIGMKDLFCTQGVQTTAASHMLEGFVPTYESTVSGKLWAAGAGMLGKLNLDQFAMGSSNETSYYGNVISPWRRAKKDGGRGDNAALAPGGSSGGSSSAIAARLCPAATGTDTGGSIRQPAAFCGVVGLKPTYGRCSRWGIIAFASSLDQAGPFTRTVADNALMLQAMASHDVKDSTSSDVPLQDVMAAVGQGVKGMKIGVPLEYVMDGMDPDVLALWQQGQDWLRQAGAELVEVSLPNTKYALPTYYIIAPAEASSNLARYDGVRYGLRVEAASLDQMYEATRAAGFGEEVQRRILIGTYVLSAGYYDAYYLKAQKVRRLIKQDFDTVFATVDALLTPATPSAAFAVGRIIDDPVVNYLNDVFTVPANLAGLPGISVPAGLNADGLPLGLQVLGKPYDEASLYRVAGVLEQAADFTAKPNRRAGGAK